MKSEKPISTDENSWAALISNGDMADANFALIERAQHEIYLVEFLVRDDEFGLMKLAVLRKKAREGVKVHVHVDAFHLLVNPALVRQLMDEGIDFTVFNELSFARLNKATTRNHCKILIIDGKLLKMGDANTGNEYVHWGEGHHMKSIDVIFQGVHAEQVRSFAQKLIASDLSKTPEIAIASPEQVRSQRAQIENMKQIAKTFFEMLQIQMDAPDQFTRPQKVFITEEELVKARAQLNAAEVGWLERKLSSNLNAEEHWVKRPLFPEDIRFHADPFDKSELTEGVGAAIRAMIRSSVKEITIVTPYLLLTDEMKHALKEALSRQVHVHIYTNSLKSTDNKTTQLAYEYRLQEIASLGPIDVYEYQGDETIHAKFILSDDEECMVMTYNLDWRSELLNLETGVSFTSALLCEDLRSWLSKHSHLFEVVATGGQSLKSETQELAKPDLLKRLIIQAIEKQL